VDRQWSTASTSYVFEGFHASLFSRSLIKLSALSRSPLAKHVKAIDFHIDQLPDHYSRKEWTSKIDFRPSFLSYRAGLAEKDDISQVANKYDEMPRHSFTPSQLDQGWQEFRRHCDEQENWNKGQEGDVLRDCVSRLQNLEEVLIDRAKPFGGRLHMQPFWRNFKNEILIGPDAWSYEARRWNSLDALTAMFHGYSCWISQWYCRHKSCREAYN
jgi:hypothetical protein